MIYHLAQYIGELYGSDPNLPQSVDALIRLTGYITVRAIAALLTSFVVTMLFGKRLIRWLHRRHMRDRVKDFGAISTTDKRGTPTMGGILIITATVIPALLWCDLSNRFVQLVLAATIWFGLLGAVDDYLKIRPVNGRRGFRPLHKLLLQGMFAVALGIVFLWPATSPVSAEIASNWHVPFYKHPVLTSLGWWYLPFIVFVVLLISNSVNLTDGMDGLAIMPANFSVVVYGVFAYVMGNAVFARYLQFDFFPGSGELLIFCSALFGAGMGFLWYNAYPAQVIMGDTGSMALGGILATLAVLLKQEVLFVIVGGVFIVEAFSSLIQEKIGEGYLGRRIFYRAPLHHQMEYQGLAETKVVVRMWIVAGILAMIGLASLKVR